jgi:hypothetical protein
MGVAERGFDGIERHFHDVCYDKRAEWKRVWGNYKPRSHGQEGSSEGHR